MYKNFIPSPWDLRIILPLLFHSNKSFSDSEFKFKSWKRKQEKFHSSGRRSSPYLQSQGELFYLILRRSDTRQRSDRNNNKTSGWRRSRSSPPVAAIAKDTIWATRSLCRHDTISTLSSTRGKLFNGGSTTLVCHFVSVSVSSWYYHYSHCLMQANCLMEAVVTGGGAWLWPHSHSHHQLEQRLRLARIAPHLPTLSHKCMDH